MPQSFGKCTLLSIEDLVSYFQISCLETKVVPFEVKGVFISSNCQLELENLHNSQKNEQLSLSVKNNPKQFINRKRNCSGETAEMCQQVKKKQLIVRREYTKNRRAKES